MRKNWSTLLERFPSSTIVRMVEGVRWLIDVAPDVEGFFAEHPVPQGTKTLPQHLERLRVNVAFRDREHVALAAGAVVVVSHDDPNFWARHGAGGRVPSRARGVLGRRGTVCRTRGFECCEQQR